jgi:serine phosphatase RsbU (regulator of sigma subunit)
VADLLGEVVQATAAAADTGDLLHRVARLLTARADWVIADRLEDPDLVVRVAAYDAAGPLTLPAGVGRTSARRSAAGAVGLLPALVAAPQRVLRLAAEDLAALAGSQEPHLASQAALALALGADELLVLGLVARDAVVGVLTLGSRSGFREEDVQELLDVALLVGLALDAARLLDGQRAIATALQTSLLPPLPAVPGLRLAARYHPAAQGLSVGGDWYDAFVLGSGLVVVIGDASGHDVQAAARMSDLRNLLRAYAVDEDQPPSAVVERMDHTAETLGLEATATCVLARLQPSGGGGWSARWTNAGHLPPIVVHEGRATLIETPPDLMLGVQPATRRWDHQGELVPGDTLLLYTDGLVEVRGESLDDRLELLRTIVEQQAQAGPDQLVEALLAALGAGASDDIALLALEVLPPSQRTISASAR